jgi:folate-binding protein YgfZ
MKNDNVYIFEDRGLLYLNGEDVKEFLQNIITNDIEKVTNEMSCFAALLTPQGKYLFDFLIIKHKAGYFLDCEKKNIDELFKQLSLYKLRSKVEILNLSNEFVVAGMSYEKFLTFDNSEDIEGFTIKYREDPIFLDPRLKKLGARLIINLEKLYLSLKKLELKAANIEDYYNLSHELGISQVDNVNLQNKIFGIECNFEELNGIDFKKGCYVGQENTARIKLKNKLNKKLFAIKNI